MEKTHARDPKKPRSYLSPFVLSFKLAGITTLILFVLALPLAWYLSQSRSRLKPFWETITALPIVLPPSVLGFYILIAFSHVELAFTFTGLVVASCLYSLPFMVQPLQGGFEGLNPRMIEASYLSGKGQLTIACRPAQYQTRPAHRTHHHLCPYSR